MILNIIEEFSRMKKYSNQAIEPYRKQDKFRSNHADFEAMHKEIERHADDMFGSMGMPRFGLGGTFS